MAQYGTYIQDLHERLKAASSGGGWSPAPGISAFESMIPGQTAVSGDLSTALINALKGQFPEEYFSEAVSGPLRRRFEAERAPAIREEFAGPGTYWGTARGTAVERGREHMEQDISGARATLAHQTQQQALQAALAYLGIPLMAAYQPYDEEGGASGGWGSSIQRALAAPKKSTKGSSVIEGGGFLSI